MTFTTSPLISREEDENLPETEPVTPESADLTEPATPDTPLEINEEEEDDENNPRD